MSSLDAAIYNEVRGSKNLLPVTAVQAFSSMTWTPGFHCLVVLRGVGAGGGGASALSATSGAATGGNSAPWGIKMVELLATDTLAFSVGAGGLKAVAAPGNGSQGSTSTVAKNGATVMTIQGGEGGVASAVGAEVTVSPAAALAAVTGADYWVPGVKAGSAQRTSSTSVVVGSGGAAVDIFSNGTGRSKNAVQESGAGGCVGSNDGTPLSMVALMDWGLMIADASLATVSYGVPGIGAVFNVRKAGAFGGGIAGGGAAALGGVGGGGGSSSTAISAGDGGHAYFYAQIYRKV